MCVFVYLGRQWLEDAMKENDPSSVLLFLVGTKKDLSVGEISLKSHILLQSANISQCFECRRLINNKR